MKPPPPAPFRLATPDLAAAGGPPHPITRGGPRVLEAAFGPAGRPAAAPGPRWRLDLPPFDTATYFAPFQKHSIFPDVDVWPDGYNQLHAMAVTDLGELVRRGVMLLLRHADGGFTGVLPITGPRSMAWLQPDGGSLHLHVGHHGTAPLAGDLPLAVTASDGDVYRLCRTLWQTARDTLGDAAGFRLRDEKAYPEAFKYLGWCSWEEFTWNIDEGVLVHAVERLNASDVAVRWALVDDGHLHTTAAGRDAADGGEAPGQSGNQRLKTLGVNPYRFPRGWAPLRAATRDDAVRWLGVWLNFNGYWGGIDCDHAMGPGLGDTFFAVDDERVVPGDGPGQAEAFYDAWVAAQAREGFDFLKVDNQSGNLAFYAGRAANAAAANAGNHRALEAAAHARGLGMINCMAHGPNAIWATRHSAVTRSSEDYKLGDERRAKLHLHNSFANMMVLAPTVWGDHDMFHSTDGERGPMLARSKALSGGPVYLSDKPDDFCAELIRPLCNATGRLYRPLAPAMPLPDSVFIDPYDDGAAFRVGAALSNDAAAVCVYNLTHPTVPVPARVTAADLADALAMAGRVAEPDTGVVLCDPAAGAARLLAAGTDDGWSGTLDAFADRLFLLCAVRDGWAVLGRPDKTLGPAAVVVRSRSAGELVVEADEPGEVWVWHDGPLTCDAAPARSDDGRLWRVTAAGGPLTLRV